MPYGTPSLARQPEHGRFNRFLASLPPHDFSLLVPHLHTITLKRGVMLHDVGEEIEHVYFPHTGMVSLVAVMQSGATVETAAIDGNDVPLTQELLAQMLGVRRTTVTVAARLLQSAGLIRYRRGHIQILDRAALEDIACECYAVVKHNADRVFAATPPLR
jgi:CRP-like cAMP-binding protein